MSKSNENQPISVVIPVGSLATTATTIPAMHLPKKSKLVSAVVLNGAAIAASDTDYAQLSLKNGSTVVAEIDTRAAHENGLTANVGKAMNLVSGQEVQEAASDLTILYAEGGTMALTNAIVVLTYFPL